MHVLKCNWLLFSLSMHQPHNRPYNYTYQSGASWDTAPASGRAWPTDHPSLRHVFRGRGETLAGPLALCSRRRREYQTWTAVSTVYLVYVHGVNTCTCTCISRGNIYNDTSSIYKHTVVQPCYQTLSLQLETLSGWLQSYLE